MYTFVKASVTEDNIDEMMTRLSNFGLSLSTYQSAFQLEEMTNMYVTKVNLMQY